jgi:hypothetical protein
MTISSNLESYESNITIKNYQIMNKDGSYRTMNIILPSLFYNSKYISRFTSRNKLVKLESKHLLLAETDLKKLNILCKRLSASTQALYCADDNLHNALTKSNKLQLFYTDYRIALLQSMFFW